MVPIKSKANKVLIYGGLGNQMFQYALFVYLNQNGVKSKFSFSTYFLHTHHHGFDLPKAFSLNLSLHNRINLLLLDYFKPIYRNNYVRTVLARIIPKIRAYKLTVYKEEKEFAPVNENLLSHRSTLFIGTWQSEGFLRNIRSILLKEFSFKPPTDPLNVALIQSIKNTNSVSIHVRRGDYLNTDWAATHHVIKDASYYYNAIEIINSTVKDAHYFIFSDDMNWVKENIEVNNATYIDNNKGDFSYVDMYLMSLCKHNIIANSTFSWWGAWLNANEPKTVIYPSTWLNGINCSPLFPSEWLSVPVTSQVAGTILRNGK